MRVSIRFKHSGAFNKTENFFKKSTNINHLKILEKYGKAGVEALASVTPTDTGKTASSWGYEISQTRSGFSLYWTNSNIQNGVQIALILQYGHGTGTGGYVEGIDYINPAIRPIFDRMANEGWKGVT